MDPRDTIRDSELPKLEEVSKLRKPRCTSLPQPTGRADLPCFLFWVFSGGLCCCVCAVVGKGPNEVVADSKFPKLSMYQSRAVANATNCFSYIIECYQHKTCFEKLTFHKNQEFLGQSIFLIFQVLEVCYFCNFQ